MIERGGIMKRRTMKRRTYLMVMLLVGFTVVGFAYFNGIGQGNASDNIAPSIKMVEVSEGISVLRVATTWPWNYFKSLTFYKIVEQSDLVAVVEIVGPIVSYSDEENFPFTLYKSRIVHCLKGTLPENVINVLQYGGYDSRAKQFILDEGEPLLRKGEYWLLFMRKMDWERNFKIKLPDNTFHLQPLTSLQYDGGQVKTPQETEAYLPKQLKISGLTIEEFKDIYMKP